jgi:ADP-ribose pyrophosphatase YjhB (NUDIX family)
LPGGTVEYGETIQDCLEREMREETALEVRVGDLLYLCDRIQDGRHILHITFLLSREGGELRQGVEPEGRAYPIEGIKMIPLSELTRHGFGQAFQDLALAGFPDRGTYQGPVSVIGL